MCRTTGDEESMASPGWCAHGQPLVDTKCPTSTQMVQVCLPTSEQIGYAALGRKDKKMLNAGEPGIGIEAGANNLLRALRPEDFELLRPHLEPRHAVRGTVLHEAGDPVEFAFFPRGAALA